MAESFELLLVSEESGQQCNINAYKASSGDSLATFKGGTSEHKTLCVYKNGCLISAIPKKAVIQVYEISRGSQQSTKMVLNGAVKSLCISHDNSMIAAGIGENVFIWELAGGELLMVLSRHYQAVTCLDFCHDDSYLVSSGADGIVAVWDLADIWDEKPAKQTNELVVPYHSWTCHTQAVTHVSTGSRYRVFSASLDRHVKIHDIPTKQTIMTVVLHSGVMSMVTTPGEFSVFAGCSDGTITKIDLLHCNHNESLDSDDKDRPQQIIKAHEKGITCMECSFDGTYIVSGSRDCQVKVWDVASHQCLRTVKCPGAVTNVKLVLATPKFFSSSKSHTTFPKLCRNLAQTSDKSEIMKKYFRLQASNVQSEEDHLIEDVIDAMAS